MNQENKNHIKGFNGIRAIAVLMVVLAHLRIADHNSTLYGGGMGVQIFFCLSGFLITYVLLKEYSNTQTINVRNFLIRRALRLLPAMLSYLLVIIFLMFLGYIEPKWMSVFFALFYIYNFILLRWKTDYLGHFWSLAVEEHFYLFYPFIFKLNKKKNLLLILLLLIVICLIVSVLQNRGIIYFPSLTKNYQWTIPAIMPILTGAIMSILLNNSNRIYKVPVYVFIILGLLLYVHQVLIPSSYYLLLSSYRLNYLFQCVGIAFILTYVYLNQKTAIVKLLEFYPIELIGRISYGIYLWHMLFANLYRIKGLNLYVAIMLSIVIPLLSYYTIEKYFLNKKRLLQTT